MLNQLHFEMNRWNTCHVSRHTSSSAVSPVKQTISTTASMRRTCVLPSPSTTRVPRKWPWMINFWRHSKAIRMTRGAFDSHAARKGRRYLQHERRDKHLGTTPGVDGRCVWGGGGLKKAGGGGSGETRPYA